MTLEPGKLKREIDAALAELDQLEADVLELFDELLGEQTARKLGEYIAAQKQQPRLMPLTREASPGPSTEPPATR